MASSGADTSPSAVRQRLYDAAVQEGELVVWGPTTDTISKYYPEQFGKAFPGVRLTGLSDNQAPSKLLTEIATGRYDADALWWPYTGALPLLERGWLAQFSEAELAAFDVKVEEADFDRRALRTANLVYGLIYDTRRVQPNELPATWDDLLKPRWQGRVAGTSLLVPFLVAGVGMINGEAWALDYARKLRDLKVTMVPDQVISLDMLLRGEKDLLVNSPAFALERKTTYHEPVEWHAVEPTFATQHVAVVLDKAAHPNAARLWALWAASAEGQKSMDLGAFEVSARPEAPTTQARLLRDAGVGVTFERADMVTSRLALYNKVRPVLFGETQ